MFLAQPFIYVSISKELLVQFLHLWYGAAWIWISNLPLQKLTLNQLKYGGIVWCFLNNLKFCSQNNCWWVVVLIRSISMRLEEYHCLHLWYGAARIWTRKRPLWKLTFYQLGYWGTAWITQAWKVLNLMGFLENSLKIKFALKSTGKSCKGLEKSLNSYIFCRN